MTEATDQQRTEALARYGQRVTELCEALYAVEDPDATAVHRIPEAIQKEAAFLVEEGPGAYLRYVEKLDDAAVRADLDRHLDEVLGEQQVTNIPLILGGDLHRCGRCKRTFTSQTWHVIENWTENEGMAWHTDVCRRCAYMDPALAEWQNLCDVMDSIDQVMQGAKDQAARNLLKDLITRHAGHMSVWRWPEDQPPYVPSADD